jgi:hypothetical protein
MGTRYAQDTKAGWLGGLSTRAGYRFMVATLALATAILAAPGEDPIFGKVVDASSRAGLSGVRIVGVPSGRTAWTGVGWKLCLGRGESPRDRGPQASSCGRIVSTCAAWSRSPLRLGVDFRQASPPCHGASERPPRPDRRELRVDLFRCRSPRSVLERAEGRTESVGARFSPRSAGQRDPSFPKPGKSFRVATGACPPDGFRRGLGTDRGGTSPRPDGGGRLPYPHLPLGWIAHPRRHRRARLRWKVSDARNPGSASARQRDAGIRLGLVRQHRPRRGVPLRPVRQAFHGVPGNPAGGGRHRRVHVEMAVPSGFVVAGLGQFASGPSPSAHLPGGGMERAGTRARFRGNPRLHSGADRALRVPLRPGRW